MCKIKKISEQQERTKKKRWKIYGNMLGFEQEKDRGLEEEKEKEKEDW